MQQVPAVSGRVNYLRTRMEKTMEDLRRNLYGCHLYRSVRSKVLFYHHQPILQPPGPPAEPQRDEEGASGCRQPFRL